jgi:drug/metabolite transporter (DMT)-like permease
VLRELSPATITVSRFGIGLIVIFFLIGPERARSAFAKDRLLSVAVLGFFGIALHQWLQANGLKTAQATVGSWIVATIPVFVAILGRVILGEILGLVRSLGIGVAGIGVLIVIGQGNPLSIIEGHIGSIGDLLFVLSALNWAVFTVISRGRIIRQKIQAAENINAYKNDVSGSVEDPLGLMFVVMFFGWLFSLLWLVADGGWRGLLALQTESVLSLLFLGIASSGLAYAFWYGGLQKIQASRAGVFLYIEPFVTAILAWPILGEKMTTATILGGATILIGVWLVNREEKK